jgi:propanol-preferring alcohol dehydrogenase
LEQQEVPVPAIGPQDVLIRVKAAGICHSDVHYRAGNSLVEPLPLTLGHEVAGIVEEIGSEVVRLKTGDRVCVHYLATCGECRFCREGTEQFCPKAAMIGKHRDGGYAEFIVMPERSVLSLPTEVTFEHGAILMCSSATSLHALKKARIAPGDSVAVFGAGGLGLSAIQLAKILGAGDVYAVDLSGEKLHTAAGFGALPINASASDPVAEIKRRTSSRGVDVALELIGLPVTMRQAVQSLAIKGRAALAGITDKTFEIAPYHEVLNKEAEIIGVSDHLASELPELLQYAREGKLDLFHVVTRTLPLEASAINGALDQLDRFKVAGRQVVVP